MFLVPRSLSLGILVPDTRRVRWDDGARRAEREAREAIEGVPQRREFPRADYSGDCTVGNVTVRRVQA